MFCLLEMRQSPGIFWLLLNLSSSIKNRVTPKGLLVLLLLLLLLLQLVPVKVNYNYFTLYKASSLNHKVI